MLALQKDRGHAQNSADWLKKNMVNVSGHTGLHAQNAHTQNARKRSGLFRSVPVSARPKIPQHLAARCRTGLHAQNAHTQNARKRSGLFRSVPVSVRPKNSSTSRSPMPHRSARAKRTHAKCTQAFRSVPVCSGVFRFPPAPKFLNISQPHGAQVCTRKTHSRKMHTSVPVCSGLFRFLPAPKFLNISQPGALEREIGTQHLVAVGNKSFSGVEIDQNHVDKGILEGKCLQYEDSSSVTFGWPVYFSLFFLPNVCCRHDPIPKLYK